MFSGLTALVYEIVWEKYLTLFLGASAYSQVVVMSSFMLGLGIGSYIFGRIAEKSKDHLQIYSIIEIGIGIYALLFPLILEFGETFYLHFVDIESPFSLVIIIKFLISFLIMMVPSILMGGTLPVLGQYIIRSKHKFGKKLSLLYFLNSFGAFIGCLLTGYFLIGNYGLRVTIYFASLMNIGIGLVVYLLRNQTDHSDVREVKENPNWQHQDKRIFTWQLKLWLLIVIFLSGFTAMMYEVIWIRILSNVLGSTTYSFSLMLAVFILGISLGSLMISCIIDRFKNVLLSAFALEIFLILTICFSLPLINRLPYYFVKLSNSLVHTEGTFYIFSILQSLICTAVMFPVSLFSGMMFPVFGMGLIRSGSGVSREIGSLYASNTFGAVLATLFTGLFLIPKIGTLNTIFVGLGINFLIVVIIVHLLHIKFYRKFLFSSIVAVVLLLMYVKLPGINPNLFLASVFRHVNTTNYASFSDFVEDTSQDYKILSYKEGMTSTIVVTEEASNGNRSLFINGKADASTSIYGDLLTQSLLGIIPHIISPGNERVLVIGMGTGNTAYTASLPASVQQVDIVEISEAVVETLPYFNSVNKGLESNPKVKIHIEDAKNFLSLTDSEYDVIISEPTNTWVSGIGNLFSTEYYHQISDHLNNNGVFVQWVQTYETSDDIILSILYTLNQVFPFCDIWYSGTSDLLITCYKQKPLHLDLVKSQKIFDEIEDTISELGIHNLEEILLLHGANENVVSRILSQKNANENSEEFPYIEYEAPKHLFINQKTTIPKKMDQRLRTRNNSSYPFFVSFKEKIPGDYFQYFNNLKFISPITERIKLLEVMYETIWYIDTPWSRKYNISDLEKNYKGADTRAKKAWFLKEVYKQYTDLVNCFVEIPFGPFLRKELSNYLAQYPDDIECLKIYNDLNTNKM